MKGIYARLTGKQPTNQLLLGLVAVDVVALYLFASWAIDSAATIAYLLSFTFLGALIVDTHALITAYIHSHGKPNKR